MSLRLAKGKVQGPPRASSRLYPPLPAYAVVLTALGFLGLGLVFEALLARAAWRNHQALAWPAAPAVVVDSAVRTHSNSRHETFYAPWIAYRYTVAGVARTGTEIGFGPTSTGRAEAARLVAQYPVGRVTTARVDPADPATAILQPGPILEPATNVAGGAAFIVLGLGLLYLVRTRNPLFVRT